MNKILIVDDELLIRYALASLFRTRQTEFFTADTGISALNIVRRNRLSLCFLDMHLPDLNGLDIMRALRAISPWTRIVIVTGTLITDAMAASIHENAHCLITKPFDLEEVESAALRLLAPGKMTCGEIVPSKKKDSCVLWIAGETRKHIRRTDGRDLACYVMTPSGARKPVPFTARVIDISESGMCLLSPRELEPGDIVRSNDGSMKSGSVVRWCMHSDPAGPYRAGIQFISSQYIDYLTGTSDLRWSDGERHGFSA